MSNADGCQGLAAVGDDLGSVCADLIVGTDAEGGQGLATRMITQVALYLVGPHVTRIYLDRQWQALEHSLGAAPHCSAHCSALQRLTGAEGSTVCTGGGDWPGPRPGAPLGWPTAQLLIRPSWYGSEQGMDNRCGKGKRPL